MAGAVALAVGMGIGRFAFTPALPLMADDGLVTMAAGSRLAASNYVGYLVGALWAMRVPAATRVTAFRVNLVLITAATLLMALPLGMTMWLLLRFAAGIASAGVLVYVSSWTLNYLAPLGRPSLSGLVFAGVGLGIMGAGAVCLWVAHRAMSASAAWIALGILALLATVFLSRRLGDRRFTTKGQTSAAYPTLAALPDRPLKWTKSRVLLVACYGVFGFGYIIPATFLPVIAQALIADPIIYGWAWPVFGIAAMASTFLAGTCAKHFGNRLVWAAGHVVMATGLATILVYPSIAGVVIAALAVGGTFMLITMVAMQEARQAAGRSATVLIAAMTAAFAAGQILGPLVTGYFVRITGSMTPALSMAAGLLLATALLVAKRPVPMPKRSDDSGTQAMGTPE